ncbi:hypothetical protein NDR87_31940 [Nocardia sp. CDC159]|uniref:Uncharacterized protein n=1 Tax=Nocardia pulmonis TaxID=2951408 RepID=A0A9X2J046_9NOCA|nr:MULTISPECIES: hypothetical protein [Nocardia]MCM6778103.1 hypothetical protein [Nocardia pulmonis]MCM6790992.1 hypothetical protein [Nocardia sp. CDC159]
MARAVAPVSRGEGVSTPPEEGDSYQERLAKYFPIETSGPYLAASAAVTGMTDPHTTARTVWMLVIFAVFGLGTIPLLLKQYPKTKYRHRWLPVGFGVGAFVIWAYSLGALPMELGVYSPIAAVVLPILYGFGANFSPSKADATP